MRDDEWKTKDRRTVKTRNCIKLVFLALYQDKDIAKNIVSELLTKLILVVEPLIYETSYQGSDFRFRRSYRKKVSDE